MFAQSKKFLSFLVSALLLSMVMLTAFAPTVRADGVPTITILEVKVDEWVKIRANNLPKNTEFTARMDKMGNYAIGGTVVGTAKSGADGIFEATFNIPQSLKGLSRIALRIDSASGYYSYNWFDNKTVTPTAQPTQSTTGKPYIEIVAVEKDKAVTVQAYRFPANQSFTVRVGPFKTFFKDYVVVDKINSGNGGSFKFTVTLPESVKGVDWITIRLDSPQKQYAYNAFRNVSSGTVISPTPPPSSGAVCQIISTSPSKALKPREDFDAIWQVKNTSGKDWDQHSVDYKFVSGTSMHKKSIYDFKTTVRNGETVNIIVDMLAPDKAGTYSATWSIVSGNKTLCTLPITITVK